MIARGVAAAAGPPRDNGAARALEHALFGVLPALVTVWLLVYVATARFGAVDFRHDFWIAGWRTLHGGDPYAWTRMQIQAGASFPYPALAALLFAPFALIGVGAASALFTAICLGSVAMALRLLDVRDWRLYGVVAMWAAVVVGWQTANLTLPLIAGVACIWRYRDRPLVSGALVALLISLKPITFPLGIWLLGTRRYRASGWALATGVVVNVIAWSLIGWGAVGGWLHLLSIQGEAVYNRGYAIVALATDLGLSRGAGTVIQVAVGFGAATLTVWLARRGEESRSLAAATLLMLVASPQVDLHYFALLLVPLAILQPRLRWPWLLGLVLWLCPASEATTWQAIVWWVVVAVLCAEMTRTAWRPRAPVISSAWS